MLSSIAADHIQHPHNVGPLMGACYGVSGVPHDGPWIEIWLRIEGERVTDAAYRTHGCPSSIAAASMICDLVRGRTVSQARLIEPNDLLVVLGGLPEGKGHFAAMACEGMNRALDQAAHLKEAK